MCLLSTLRPIRIIREERPIIEDRREAVSSLRHCIDDIFKRGLSHTGKRRCSGTTSKIGGELVPCAMCSIRIC